MPKTCSDNSPKAGDSNYICNPLTGRWVKITSVLGKKILTTKEEVKGKGKTLPVKTYTEEERLKNALRGLSYGAGGLNHNQLLAIAIGQGFRSRKSVSKAVLIEFIKAYANASASTSASSFSLDDCSSDEDPFKMEKLVDCEQGVISLPSRIEGNKPICLCKETLWEYFKSHIESDLGVLQEVSKNNFSGISPINMETIGSVSNIFELKNVKDFLSKRSKIAINKKQYKDPNALYEIKRIPSKYPSVWTYGYPTRTARQLIEDFMIERIDTERDLHVEKLLLSLLGGNVGTEANLNIGSTPPSAASGWRSEWVQLIELIYGSWIAPDGSISYLSYFTSTARLSIDRLNLEDKRKLVATLLIDMYNTIIINTGSAQIAKDKIILLLYAMQQSLE